MSLLVLPQEVLETLFLYLQNEDLLTVWKVVEFEGSDFFWRKLCEREGYKDISSVGFNYKEVFFNNINWTTEKYVKYKHTFHKPYNESTVNLLHGENLLVQSTDEISVWNVDMHMHPVLIQKLPGRYPKVNGTKLFAYNKPNLTVYSCINNIYYEIMNFSDIHRIDSFAASEKYLAVGDKRLSIIKVFNLEQNEDFPIALSTERHEEHTIKLLRNILYIVRVSTYLSDFLWRFNLDEMKWMDDWHMPNELYYDYQYFFFEINFDLLVIGCCSSSPPVSTFIHVWKLNGEFLKSLSMKFITGTSVRMDYSVSNQLNILWLIAKDEYLIFSTYVTNVIIWDSKNPDVCKHINKTDKGYLGQDVISSHLLVLSYTNCFYVVDFKKATYLYVVQLDRPHPTESIHFLHQQNWSGNLSPKFYFVNEHFYVHMTFDYVPYKTDKCRKLGECSHKKSPGETSFIYYIYDFRSQVQ